MPPLLIVGLGNPGREYTATRHNIGFMIVEALAKQLRCKFQKEFLGECAHGIVEGRKVLILKPHTYMNRSGDSVGKCVDFFKLTPLQLLIVCDDADLPFGKFRFRQTGSCGGHNGLKSIEYALKTRDYGRLKVGVGRDLNCDLADYVLSPFSPEEKSKVEEIEHKASEVILTWIKEGFEKAQRDLQGMGEKLSPSVTEDAKQPQKKVKED